ncbi:MAG: hypothetical protein ACO3T7_09715 [Pseudomonadales bacterium]|jgi:hypothetical protein
MKKLILAVSVGLFSQVALAHGCPGEMKKIDAKLPTATLSAADASKVKEPEFHPVAYERFLSNGLYRSAVDDAGCEEVALLSFSKASNSALGSSLGLVSSIISSCWSCALSGLIFFPLECFV